MLSSLISVRSLRSRLLYSFFSQAVRALFCCASPLLMCIVSKTGKLPELEKLMSDFAFFHRTAQPAPVTPRSGDHVAAKFTADKQWYRARVKRSNPAKKQAEVIFYE